MKLNIFLNKRIPNLISFLIIFVFTLILATTIILKAKKLANLEEMTPLLMNPPSYDSN